MPIAESQLETWSHQGSVQQSSNTYQIVRNALLKPSAEYADKDFEVYLQGSYANDTNIYAESDVDTIIQLSSIMRSDLSALPPEQQAAYHRAYVDATYRFDEFKRGVVSRLSNAFGTAAITLGNKTIKIKANGSRRSADVIVCHQYRRYIRFISEDDQEYVPGVIFPITSAGEIINYPKQHSANCTAKHQATNSWFKPMVRILKNLRSMLVDAGEIVNDTAPSYYLECMLWNVPDGYFGVSYQDTFCNGISWLFQTDRSKLVCVNEQYYLLGENFVQWPEANCDLFLKAAIKKWKGW